jgi:hypothetical protein
MIRLLFALGAQVLSPGAAPELSLDTLKAEIAAVDAEYFRLLWKDCEAPEKLRALISPDQEFFHDQHGLTIGPAADLSFVARRCDNLARTGASTRRVVVPGTFRVDPVPGFGAVATGEHRFYRTDPGKPERNLGSARFSVVWKRTGASWQSYRVLSLDHRNASKP